MTSKGEKTSAEMKFVGNSFERRGETKKERAVRTTRRGGGQAQGPAQTTHSLGPHSIWLCEPSHSSELRPAN